MKFRKIVGMLVVGLAVVTAGWLVFGRSYLWQIERHGKDYFQDLIQGNYEEACQYLRYFRGPDGYDSSTTDLQAEGCAKTVERMAWLEEKGITLLEATEMQAYYFDDYCGKFRVKLKYEEDGEVKYHEQEYSIQPCGSDPSKFYLSRPQHVIDLALSSEL